MIESVEPAPADSWLGGMMAPRVEPDRDGSPPDQHSLTRILQAATTVPDHGGLHPWRFAVVSGPGKKRLADALAAGVLLHRGSEVPAAVVAKMRDKAFAAPCTIALIASPDTGSNVPEWEQVVSASCTGYAMVLAANALGLGAVWKSAAVLDTPPVRRLFALTEDERLLGWINVGSPTSRPKKRQPEPPPLDALITVIDTDDSPPSPAP